MTEFEHRINDLMEEAAGELLRIGIKPARNISGICENRRAKKRLGCCKLEKNGLRRTFRIEISTVLAEASDKVLKQVILHELLHTCPGCFNHGEKWKKLAEQVNYAYGYCIQRLSTPEELGMAAMEREGQRLVYKYRIRCKKCGTASYRMRKSRVVEKPQKYRCAKCGGALEVDQL